MLDRSAPLANRKALRLVLTAAASWLQAVLYGRPDRRKLTVIDEGWTALDDLAIVRFLQDQWRLGRQWGCANILITHALADLRSQTDDHTAHGKIAEGLLNTTSVRVYPHQQPDQVGRLLSDLGLTSTEAALLPNLAPFQALWKVGAHTALVDHHIDHTEWSFCDTDAAMTGRTCLPRGQGRLATDVPGNVELAPAASAPKPTRPGPGRPPGSPNTPPPGHRPEVGPFTLPAPVGASGS